MEADSAHLDVLRGQVDRWFTAPAISELLGRPTSQTEQIGQAWLAGEGKRWRPVVMAGVSRAVCNTESNGSADLQRLGTAVECFHKASLIHDDIEDHDLSRYGAPTLHARHGVPVALNVGDYLLGEGYRLICGATASAECKARMLAVAAEGHCELSLGQGQELEWRQHPCPLPLSQVLLMLRAKTAPAFVVAVRLGLLHGGGSAGADESLRKFSLALGTAYQIRDDLYDVPAEAERGLAAGCLSVLEAIVWDRTLRGLPSPAPDEVQRLAHELFEDHIRQALAAAREIQSSRLRSLLERLVRRVFEDASFCLPTADPAG